MAIPTTAPALFMPPAEHNRLHAHPHAWMIQTVFRKKERSGLQSACDELIDKGAIITGE
jgi:hypothetical protein